MPSTITAAAWAALGDEPKDRVTHCQAAHQRLEVSPREVPVKGFGDLLRVVLKGNDPLALCLSGLAAEQPK